MDKTFNLKTEPFTLVLSGGGALGIAHLGVLYDLERLGIKPDEIVGASMGGIIGSCMAIGMSEAEIFSQVREMRSIYNWIKLSLSGNSIIDTRKIAAIFDGVFDSRKMCDTEIPLKLIATNLHDGSKKVFAPLDDVLIRDALLATMAIPGIFKEQTINGEAYGDGFLCENLGLNEAEHENILAVDVLGKNSFQKDLPDRFFKTAKVLEMFEKSMRLLIYNQTRTALKHIDKNILLLEPETSGYKTYQFQKADALRQLGMGVLQVD